MSQAQKKINTAPKSEATVEVLYQRLGNKWFAFSLVGDDVFVGSVPDEAITGDSAAAGAPTFETEGNS